MQYPANLVDVIKAGKYAVIPTDTIYGIVTSALNKAAVEELYSVRKRNTGKPFIVLISNIKQLDLFKIQSDNLKEILDQYWPGPTSIIIPCPNEEFEYIHRGTNAIAFRLPKKEDLRELIDQTGPIVAPSANPEQLSPATTIEEAKKYFGDSVSLYVDGGEVHGEPSAIISIEEDGKITKIR